MKMVCYRNKVFVYYCCCLMAYRRRRSRGYRKRFYRRRDHLTGGTKDFNWQTQHGNLCIPNGSAYTEEEVQVPHVRISRGRPGTIMEVLRIEAEIDSFEPLGAAQATTGFALTFSRQQAGAANQQYLDSPAVFARFTWLLHGAFTAAGTGFTNTDLVKVRHMDDGAGHGTLIALDKYWTRFSTHTTYGGVEPNTTAARYCLWKLFYRLKNVTLTEYIGVVQQGQ